MRFNNRDLFRISAARFTKKKEFQKIFMNNLDLSVTEADKLVDMNIFDFPRHRVIKTCSLYQKYNINVKPLENFQFCLRLRSYTLEHRINILKELGVPEINSFLLHKIFYLSGRNISKFIKETNIPANQNISQNLFDKLGYDVPKEISDMKLSINNLTLKQYYKICLLHCKTRVFDLPYLDDKILLNSYIKFKSISMIADTLKVLRIDLDYNKEMIKKFPFVIVASADNIKALLNEFTDICGIPIVTFLRKYPSVLLQDAKNIKQLLISIERYKIPEAYVKNCIKIFSIDNDTFLKRMKKIKQNPNLNMWYEHPRFLQIVCHKHRVERHMEYLHIVNRSKWASLHKILCKPCTREKLMQSNTSLVVFKRSLKYVLIKELGTDKTELLTKHQHWRTVGFTDIVQMLQYLKKHFTINEICQNIHIVLYAQPKVEKILTDLKQQYSQNTKYSFTNSQYLALCLYTLEKDTHFTGDGIWSDVHNTKQQFREDENTKGF